MKRASISVIITLQYLLDMNFAIKIKCGLPDTRRIRYKVLDICSSFVSYMNIHGMKILEISFIAL